MLANTTIISPTGCHFLPTWHKPSKISSEVFFMYGSRGNGSSMVGLHKSFLHSFFYPHKPNLGRVVVNSPKFMRLASHVAVLSFRAEAQIDLTHLGQSDFLEPSGVRSIFRFAGVSEISPDRYAGLRWRCAQSRVVQCRFRGS